MGDESLTSDSHAVQALAKHLVCHMNFLALRSWPCGFLFP